MKRLGLLVLCSLLVLGFSPQWASAQREMTLRFFYPVGVAGPLGRVIGEMADEYNRITPGVRIEAIYSGGYADTIARALTAAKAKNPPDLAVLTAADVWAAYDADIIEPLDSFVQAAGGSDFLKKFYPAFLRDGEIKGHTYAIPFQKSTPIFYYNKTAFREAGLDPERPPQNWTELLDMAKKLTVVRGGEVVRWGLQIPIDQWLFSAYVMQNGGRINNEEGTQTFLNSPEAVAALQFMVDMAVKDKIMPPRRFFGDASADFVAGKTAMMYNSTGGLPFVRGAATFDWDVAFLPMGKHRIVPTGGGQFVIFKGVPQARQQAAWNFIIWMTSAENAGKWSVRSGYVTVRPDALQTTELKQLTAEFPQSLVALKQLPYAHREPPYTHEGRRISRIITDAVEAALAGKTAPREALEAAQREADAVLASFRK
jgi:sn-glycerol 3-phosphate transport system substrate-binding protein